MLLKSYASGCLNTLAVDPSGIFTTEKGGNASYIIRDCYPTQRSTLRSIGSRFGCIGHGASAKDRSRRNGVDGNAPWAKFKGQISGKYINTPFHNTIG